MLRKFTIPFFLICLGVCSCHKDSPPDYPTVQISSPYSLATFNVPGTIEVKGHVSDSRSLTSVSVYVANAQNIPVEQSVQIPVTSNNMDISYSYSLNDNHLASGQYYMTITASNGTNISSAFQQIYIDASPTLRTAIYAITCNNSGVHIWKLDSAFHSSLNYSVSGDYSSSDINSYYQQLYIAGHDSGNVNVYSVPAGVLDWTIPGASSPAPYFTNVYCSYDDEYVSYYNSSYCYVKCFNHNGGLQKTYNAYTGYYPIKSFLWNGWFFAEGKSISLSGGENLATYYNTSGSAFQQINLPGPVVSMCGYDNTHIFVFGNNNSGLAYMEFYDVSGNLFYSPVSLPTAQLLSVAQINANTYLLGFNDGIIYQYTYNPNSIGPYLSGLTASAIRYDNINNEIIASSGNTIYEYTYNGSVTPIATVTLSDSIRDIRVLYNK